MGAELFDGHVVGNQLFICAHIKPHEAGMGDGWTGDADVDFERAGISEELDERAGSSAPHDRVVDHHDALPFEVLRQCVELELHALAPELLGRLDERPADVAVLDEPVVERDATDPTEADGRRHGGIGYGHDDIGIDPGLGGQHLAQALADVVHAGPVPHGVGTAEVHELKRAAGLLRRTEQALAPRQLVA